MIVLDLCCRKGGAAMGYRRLGARVFGVDIEDQPGYPGEEFWRANALNVLEALVETKGKIRLASGEVIVPDLVHQSWPCQEGNTQTARNRACGIVDDHEQFIPRARELSNRLGIPYVIEQPTSSRSGLIRRDLTLCMDMFKKDMPPPWVQKHRSFEISGFEVQQPEHPGGPVRGGSMAGFPKPAGHAGRVRGWRHSVYYDGPYVAAYGKGGGKATAAEIAHAMQIDWMSDRFDLCEAIPPAFTEYIGRSFMDSVATQGRPEPAPRAERLDVAFRRFVDLADTGGPGTSRGLIAAVEGATTVTEAQLVRAFARANRSVSGDDAVGAVRYLLRELGFAVVAG